MFIDVVTFQVRRSRRRRRVVPALRHRRGGGGVHNSETFCTSLAWRQDIQTIYESSPQRIQRYGQRGYAVVGGVF